MRLYIKSSNSLYLLVDELIRAIRDPASSAGRDPLPGNTVFTPVYIVTQTDGMQAWLKMRIAEAAGIATNLVFIKPNELIGLVYTVTGGRYESALSVADIQWLIFKALNDPGIIQKYPALGGYYNDGDKRNHVKRIGLAQKLADLFDQYEVYRTDMLNSWENEKLTTSAPEEKWQMDIWNMIRTEAGKKLPDKRRMKDAILHNLADHNNIQKLQSKIPAVYFFGTSLITSFHYQILQSVSVHIPITFYLPNPAAHIYWYEDKSKKALFYQRKKGIPVTETVAVNPLLINWGKLVQNTFRLLFSCDDALNLYDDIEALTDRHSLLSSVQSLIHQNTVADKKELFSNELLHDKSITIRSCFSVAREVEALYNFLVKLIDENPGKYSPRDIVVHVTRIDRYSSYIRSVFDNAPHRLRYSIADESFAAADTTSKALYEILTLEERDFTSEKVVQLLNFSSLRNHFGIKDVGAIRKIVTDANIRHGIEGEIQNDSVYVSWAYGLKRIMFGICISTQQEYETGDTGFFPLDTIEGNEANEIIRFVYFVEKLIHFLRDRGRSRTVSRWIEYVHEVLRHLVYDEEQRDNPEYQQLTEHINNLMVSDKLFNEPISYQVFLKQFLPGLTEMSQGYKFARGGITFCSLIPMRSIPFKIVAMLGLDFDKFPRKPNITGFDLIHKFPMPGDRNIKVNDKHLFLETLMSAGDYLYLSYTGQRIKDNAKLPPSILVDELIGFIESCSQQPEAARNILLKEEPLHGFSAKYGNEPGYDNFLLGGGKPVVLERETNREEIENDTLDLTDIYQFFSDSVGWYYKKVIGIYFDDQPVALPEAEMFELDNLQRWTLKNTLLLKTDDDIYSFINYQKKTGAIPLKSAGEYEVTRAREEIEQVKLLFDNERQGYKPATENIEIEIDRIKITATVDFVFGDKVLIPCFSKNENKYYLRAWLTGLILSGAKKNCTVIFISETRRVAKKYDYQEAISILQQLIALMREGRQRVFPFNINWFPFAKPPDKDQLAKKIEKEAEHDSYLDLFIHDGIPDNALELYETIAQKVIPSVIKTFEEEATL